jgi:cytochrome P450
MTEPVAGLSIVRHDASRPFDPPAELAQIREKRPIAPMIYPDGHDGWLVTGYEQARAVLGHPGFSSRYELLHVPWPGVGQLPPAPVGELGATDPPEHGRYRKLLAGWFTARRMRELTERVEEFTAKELDAIERQGPPVDIMQAFARPIPALAICEILGVPYEDRETFQHHTEGMVGREGVTPEDQQAAWGAMVQYISDLVQAKRENPADDLLSVLTTSDLTDEELVGIGTYLLGAGLHTTSNVIGMSTYALLMNPEQLAALRSNPELAGTAVDELLRYVGIGPFSVRAALQDTEIDGCPIKAGQSITISLDAANRDPKRFVDPDVLDLHRNATGHVTFLHGIHQCLGQHLARTELRVALPALFTRFPTLRLAIPAEEVPLRTSQPLYDVDRLPVTWDV